MALTSSCSVGVAAAAPATARTPAIALNKPACIRSRLSFASVREVSETLAAAAQTTDDHDPGERGHAGPGGGRERGHIDEEVHVRAGRAAGVGVEVELQERAQKSGGLGVEP